MKHSAIQKSMYILVTGFFLLISMACSDNEVAPEPGTGEIAVQFSAGIQSRAVDTDWSPRDSIGISMLKSGTTTVLYNTFNRRYNTDDTGSGTFQPADTDQIIYFPQDGTEVKFKAYYPYRRYLPADHLIPVDVSHQGNLPEIDLMTAEHVSGFSKTTPNASLKFHHRLTKLSFYIIPESSAQVIALDGSEFLIEGLNTTATYNLLNESLEDIATPATIQLPASGNNYLQRRAIVLPHEAGTGVEFILRLTSGEYYTAALDNSLELKAGHHYKFSMTLKPNQMIVGVTIVDWEDGGIHTDSFVMNISTPSNENVDPGDTLRVFQRFPSTNAFTYITTYTYKNDFIWHPNPVVYWSDMGANSGTFRAYTIKAEKYNDTQMDEILVSGDVTVDKNETIGLELKRAVAKVVFSLNSSNGVIPEDRLKKMTITLPKYKVGGHIDEFGQFTPGTDDGDIVVANNVGDNNNSSIALIQPQVSPLEGAIVSDGNAIYKVLFNSAVEFKAGVTTWINIDLNETAVMLGVKFIDWEDGNQISVTSSLTIDATLENTPDFFIGKKIHVYEVYNEYIRVGAYPFEYNGTKWTGPGTIYFEELSEYGYKVNLTAAYYPVGNEPGLDRTKSSFEWSTAADQNGGYANYDLLWSRRMDYEKKHINLNFEHAMSKIIVEIIKGDGITDADLVDMKISINNLSLKSTVDMVQNKVQVIPVSKTTVTPWKENATSYRYSCLVPPQEITTEEEFMAIKLEGYNQLFTGKLEQNLKLESGKESLISVTIQKTRIELAAKLQEWGKGSEGSVTIQ